MIKVSILPVSEDEKDDEKQDKNFDFKPESISDYDQSSDLISIKSKSRLSVRSHAKNKSPNYKSDKSDQKHFEQDK